MRFFFPSGLSKYQLKDTAADSGLWSLCILQNKSLLTKLFTHVNDSFLQACDIPLDTRLEMLQVNDGICYKLPGAMKSNKSTSVCFSKVST